MPGERQLPPFLFCGEMSDTSRQTLHAQMQEKRLFVTGIPATRHASMLAVLALQRLHEGKEDDPLLLEPLYLRRPSITTSTRKQPLVRWSVRSTVVRSRVQTEREEGALRH